MMTQIAEIADGTPTEPASFQELVMSFMDEMNYGSDAHKSASIQEVRQLFEEGVFDESNIKDVMNEVREIVANFAWSELGMEVYE